MDLMRYIGTIRAMAVLALIGAPVYADLNKCRDASGRVTYTDQACPSTTYAPKRVEVPPLPKADLAGLPRDAQGRPILGQGGGAAIVLEKRATLGRTNVLAACSSLVTRCYQPGVRELDDCFASVPRCASARPWEDAAYQPCCPEACRQLYDAQRKAGATPQRALDLALFGGGSPARGCLPAR